MGGAVGGDFTDAPKGKVKGEETERFGNETPWAEFNIYGTLAYSIYYKSSLE